MANRLVWKGPAREIDPEFVRTDLLRVSVDNEGGLTAEELGTDALGAERWTVLDDSGVWAPAAKDYAVKLMAASFHAAMPKALGVLGILAEASELQGLLDLQLDNCDCDENGPCDDCCDDLKTQREVKALLAAEIAKRYGEVARG
jgi:hypothetical protein